jgi:hypothetical protein
VCARARVCFYVHVQVCAHARTRVCVCVYVCVCVCVRERKKEKHSHKVTRAHTYTQAYTHTHTSTRTNITTRTNLQACSLTRARAHTHTHTHTRFLFHLAFQSGLFCDPASQAGLPQCLRVGLSHGWSAKPFSSATEQQRQADIVHVDVQPQEKDLHEGGVQSLASLKAAAEAHVPSGTANIGTIPILSLNGETVGSFELPADIFGQDIRRDILQRVVRWQLAKRQQGTHSTKGRSEVRGGGRKPIPQKKTGNARAGSIRSPLVCLLPLCSSASANLHVLGDGV